MDQGRAKATRRRSRWVLGGIVLLLFLTIVMVAYAAPQTQGKRWGKLRGQPIAFSHKTHADKGIDCLYCHSNAPRGQVASIPSVEKCMGCHQVVTPRRRRSQMEVEKIRDAWARHAPLRWEKMFDQPDFVYFSHRPHVQAGLACEDCHGDIGRLDMPKPDYSMTMGYCLDCHQKQAPEKVAKLTDCATCHK
ncbi:MAG: cytochrome c3 family protein [Chloroflexi bacterium]|nr:cytochrome c3 family protein [Chloroflexota bacterium]